MFGNIWTMSEDKNAKDTQHELSAAGFDDTASPTTSPRDKKTRVGEMEERQIPGASSRKLFTARDLLVAGTFLTIF